MRQTVPAMVDFPTPPLPEATTTICFTPRIRDLVGKTPLRGMDGAGLGLRIGIP